jgi:hypothetical protein
MRTFSVWSAVAAALVFLVLSVPPARAEELTGTWQGTLTGDGQAIAFTVAFSEDGYALYEYKCRPSSCPLPGRSNSCRRAAV